MRERVFLIFYVPNKAEFGLHNCGFKNNLEFIGIL